MFSFEFQSGFDMICNHGIRFGGGEKENGNISFQQVSKKYNLWKLNCVFKLDLAPALTHSIDMGQFIKTYHPLMFRWKIAWTFFRIWCCCFYREKLPFNNFWPFKLGANVGIAPCGANKKRWIINTFFFSLLFKRKKLYKKCAFNVAPYTNRILFDVFESEQRICEAIQSRAPGSPCFRCQPENWLWTSASNTKKKLAEIACYSNANCCGDLIIFPFHTIWINCWWCSVPVISHEQYTEKNVNEN